jgi:hypothetical protein
LLHGKLNDLTLKSVHLFCPNWWTIYINALLFLPLFQINILGINSSTIKVHIIAQIHLNCVPIILEYNINILPLFRHQSLAIV